MYFIIIGPRPFFYFCAAAFSNTCSECFFYIALVWFAWAAWSFKTLIFCSWCFSDPRVRGWLLLDNYPPTLFFTIVYLLIVWMGPKYMKNRQPFSCRGILVVYNLALTLLSLYMFYEVGKRGSYFLKLLRFIHVNECWYDSWYCGHYLKLVKCESTWGIFILMPNEQVLTIKSHRTYYAGLIIMF